MGLLIGASCITLAEILDLFLYNLLLKCLDAGHRKRAVSVAVLPAEQPVDNTTVDMTKIEETEKYLSPRGYTYN